MALKLVCPVLSLSLLYSKMSLKNFVLQELQFVSGRETVILSPIQARRTSGLRSCGGGGPDLI